MTLTFTGERFLPECAGEIIYEHWHRYLIAHGQATDKRVLDIPCGEGYGSNLLATGAGSVLGIDISSEAVAHATARYDKENLRFVAADCTNIPEPNASFDVIISFEMIEHITAQEAFLQEVARLLKPDGLLIISSPNRPEYSDRTGYKNEYHVKELDRAELKGLLDPHFPAQTWFAQRAAFHSMIWPLESPATGAVALTSEGDAAYPEPLYFVVFCARNKARLEGIKSELSLVTDREQSVYSEWSRTYRENAMLHAEIVALKSAASPTAIVPAEAPVVPAHEPWLVRAARVFSGAR
ncbi:MAG: class I SAM-dependent methyltransferase [Casimicrobium sp.]|jgi:SAM-dependent methyltransferase